MKRKEIIKAYRAGSEAVIKLVSSMAKVIARQAEYITELKKRIKALEDRLSQNSTNSSKPPSTDWPKKKRSLRKKTGRSPGGQKGHKGYNLKMVDNPESIRVHRVSTCSKCGSSLEDVLPTGYRKRQVFDLPPIKVEVTEHRTEEKICPHCGQLNEAFFPGGINQQTQYGSRIKSILTYLNSYQLLPYERTSELFSDLFDIELSAGTIVNANRVCSGALKSVEEMIKEIKVGIDDTNIRAGLIGEIGTSEPIGETEKKVLIASAGEQTIGSPFLLKLVFKTTGTPISSSTAFIISQYFLLIFFLTN